MQYFGDTGRLANRPMSAFVIGDVYNETRIARDSTGTISRWWLRSPGFTPHYAAYVRRSGELNIEGRRIYWFGDADFSIRPALWLSLEP